MTCNHVYTLYNSAGREYLACLLCLKPKPEPEYFSDCGDADREKLEREQHG